jgi:SAM-dependent methyltransferase
VADDRQELRRTFDSAADRYHEARPEYPEHLFETLIDASGLRPGDRLLEIGCATGKATLPLAHRGVRITCVEIGPALAAVARTNLADFADVNVIEDAFETWQPPASDRFDLVFAATAWHWLDPALRYEQARRLLRPGGHLAIWSALHVFPEGGDQLFAELQDVYEEVGQGLPGERDVATTGRTARRSRRDPARGAVRGRRRTALRLGGLIRRRRLSPPARHVLRAHRDGAAGATAPVPRDQRSHRPTTGRPHPAALARDPPHRAPRALTRRR